MAVHDLIVLGASAGGVEAVSAVLAGLPDDLPAAVCVVIHLRPDVPSRLAQVLSHSSVLPVVAARDRMPLRPGTVYACVPDLHMTIDRDKDEGEVLRLVRGPRENRVRPAVDPLFRSAALVCGPRVIGVILSGALDDGTSGLWTVKDRGGIALVQEPDDAAVSSMPAAALAEVDVDQIASARELGPLIGRLTHGNVREAAMAQSQGESAETEREVAITSMDEAAHLATERYGVPSRFSCPDCGGVLWDLTEGGPMRFRCEVGHAHSAATLAEAQAEVVEAALWSALRALEDKAELARRRGVLAADRGLDAFVTRYAAEEHAAMEHGAALRALLRLDGRWGLRPRISARDAGASIEADPPLDVAVPPSAPISEASGG